MKFDRFAFSAIAILCAFGVASFACDAGNEVSYRAASADAAPSNDTDAATAPGADAGAGKLPLQNPPDAGDAGTGVIEDAATITSTPCGTDVDGGLCDTTEGFGCCIPAGGASAFCVDELSAPSACAGGVFLECRVLDSLAESACCWTGASVGPGAMATYTSDCKSRAIACLDDTSCTPGVSCMKTMCSGVTFGACGVSPVCP